MDPVTSPGPTTGEGGISACQAISSPPDQVASMVSSAIVRGPPRSHERDPRVNVSEHRVDATPHPLESGAAHHGGEAQAEEPGDGAQACPQGNDDRTRLSDSRSSCDDERTDLARLNQPPNASAAGSLIGPGRSWRVRSLAAIGRDFRRRRPAPSKGTASRHLDQPNQSLHHSRLSEHPQTGSTAPADKVTTPALLPPMTQPVEVRWKGLRAGARLSPWDIFGGSTLPSVSHRRTGTYEQQEAEARDRKVQREAEGAREEPIHPAWSAD